MSKVGIKIGVGYKIKKLVDTVVGLFATVSEYFTEIQNWTSGAIVDVYTSGAAHGEGANAFRGGVLAPSGKVILVPFSLSNIGIYDPDDKTSTLYYLCSAIPNKL